MLVKLQKMITLRSIGAYRTVITEAATAIAGFSPIDTLLKE